MNRTFLLMLLLTVVCTGIGLVCGFYGGSLTGGGGPEETAGTEPDAAPVLAPQTLRNMGVVTSAARLTTFNRYTAVPAEVSSLPDTRQKVYTPVAGRIRTVAAEFTSVVRSGDVLCTLVRDPLPRAELLLTRHILEPSSEILHETMTRYRRAAVSLEIHVSELRRLESVSGGEENPVIPKGKIIQLQYERKRAEQELASLKHELERHGLSSRQIQSVEKGCFPSIDVQIWLGALEHNGFWTPLARKIHGGLPESLRTLPWTVATIGEIVAGGFADDAVAEWLRSPTGVGRHFLEIGGLLQRGHSLADIQDLHTLGAFDAVVTIRAPAAAEDWDVEAVLVRPGQHVDKGEALVTLKDPRRLFLRAEPTGGEIEVLLDALKSGAAMEARPLVPGAAPPLRELTLRKVFYEATGRTSAYLSLANAPLAAREEKSGGTFRTWQLGEGQKYMLRVPTATHEKVYVFPTGAVTDDGPDRVVFLESGDGFRPIKVEILHQDHEVVVIPGTADIFPGNPIVTHGAFALGLALGSAALGGGGDQGHGHSH